MFMFMFMFMGSISGRLVLESNVTTVCRLYTNMPTSEDMKGKLTRE